MKTNLLKMGLAIAAAGIMITSCKKDDGQTNSSATSTDMSFGVKADNPSVALTANSADNNLTTQASSGAASITWTSGTANISGFKFEAKRRGLEIEIKSKAMASVDIFAPVPTMVTSVIDTGVYREIEIRVELTKTAGNNLPLLLKGTFTTSGGVAVPIELDFNDDAIIKAEADNVVVDNTTNISTVVSMHLNKLFDHVTSGTLDAATRTGGAIIISSTSNTGIYNAIKNNIGNCGGSNGFDHSGRH